jgi:hypothetical protein
VVEVAVEVMVFVNPLRVSCNDRGYTHSEWNNALLYLSDYVVQYSPASRYMYGVCS